MQEVDGATRKLHTYMQTNYASILARRDHESLKLLLDPIAAEMVVPLSDVWQ